MMPWSWQRELSLATVVLVGILLPAAVGFAIGAATKAHQNTADDPGTYASSESVSLYLPNGWDEVRPPRIPGIELTQVVSAAAGSSDGSGLVAGTLPPGSGPLPPKLLERLRTRPRPQLVIIGASQALRYRDLRVAGFDRRLTLFALPTPTGYAAVVCYAKSTSALASCERTAGDVELLASGPTTSVKPSPQYAQAVTSALQRLRVTRTRERARLRDAQTPGIAHSASVRLAHAYTVARNTIAAARAPDIVRGANAALVQGLTAAADSYRQMAAAAGLRSPGRWHVATLRANSAETALARRLRGLASLGYDSGAS